MKQNDPEKPTFFLWTEEGEKRVRLVTVVDDLATTSSYSTGASPQDDLLTLDKKLREKGFTNIIYDKPDLGILNSLSTHPPIPA